MSVTKVKRKREEGGGKRHNLTSCFAGFNPGGCFMYDVVLVTPLTKPESSQLQHRSSCLCLLINVSLKWDKEQVPQKTQVSADRNLDPSNSPRLHLYGDYTGMFSKNNHDPPLQYESSWTIYVRLCFRADKNSQSCLQ